MPKEISTTVDTSRIDKLRWLTLLLQVVVGSVTAYVYLVSLYIGPLAETYGWNPATIVLEFTIMTVTGIPACIIGGRWRDKYGSRWCLKVGGVGFAISVAISAVNSSVWFYVLGQGVGGTFFMYVVYVAAIANVGELFPDKRGLAVGLAIAGINIGSAMLSPFCEFLIRTIGPTMSIAIQGVVFGVATIICGFIITEAPENYRPSGWEPKEAEKLDNSPDNKHITSPRMNESWKKIIKVPSFWVVCLAIGFGAMIVMGCTSNLSLIAQDCLGLNTTEGAWIYTLFSVTCCIGAFGVGFFSDKFGPMKVWAIGCIITCVAVVALLLFGLNNLMFFAVVIAWIGILGGANQTLIPAALMMGFGEKTFGVNFGIFQCLGCFTAMAGSQASVMLDAPAFFVFGVIGCALGAIVSFIAIPMVDKYHGFKVFG